MNNDTLSDSNDAMFSQEKNQRLVITHIINDFFKSYAGKQCLGPFHKPGEESKIVPNSDFVVSRTAKKDGSSDYFINGKKRSFKEVGVLLRQSGIDLDHNRFLILQGEVEQISMMRPKAENENDEGMLEYLEDIIGSSRFKEPIENLTVLVESLNEQRREKLSRVKAVEKEKDELEGAKDEAVKYLSMENEITKQKSLLYQKYSSACLKNVEKGMAGRADVQTKLDEIQSLLKEMKEVMKVKAKEEKAIKKEFEKLAEAAEISKKTFAEFENTDCALQKELQHKQSDCKKLEKSLQKEKEKFEELKLIPEKNRNDIERLSKTQVDLQTEKIKEEDNLKEVMAGLKHETQDLQAEKEEKEQCLLEKQKLVNETKSKLDIAKSELEIYQRQHNGLQNQLKAAQQNLENVSKSISQQQRNNVISALMSAKKSGELPGVYGRLGDLGAIDQKYDVAISTACGPLDFVVVDTMDTAAKCVQFLKRNNVGSTTFIALDKMERWREHAQSKIKTPENVPRLFDLIQVEDSSVANAFFYAIQNTLVADTLDQATHISYGKGSKRYRVVTVKGELIEQSGTMSGGGRNVARGRMGQRVVQDVDESEIEIMQKNLQSNEDKLEAILSQKASLQKSLENTKKELTEKKHELERATMENDALVKQQAELDERIDSIKQQIETSVLDQNHLKNLQHLVNVCEQDHNKASNAASCIEDSVQKLHKKIMDIGGAKLKTQQVKVNSVNKLIDEVAQDITKVNVAVKTANRNIAKSESKITSLEKDIQANSDALEKLLNDVKTLEEDAVKILEDYHTSQQKMQTAEEELKKVQEECKVFEKQESELKEKEVDLKHDVQKFDNIMKENNSKLKHWKAEIGKLELHNLGNDEEENQETFPVLSEQELEDLNKEEVMYAITVKEEQLAQLKPNMAAITEYRKKEEAYLDRVSQLGTITEERDIKRKDLEATRKQRLDEFMSGFSIITTKLKEMYQMITLGGDAELELVDSLDPFSEGIVFSVRPPKKSWKNISNLSGGEKTLSSLALVFALHHFKPTPLYVMDEIDAALDFKNVSIVANYIKERTKNAQFIIISLRNNMFELSDRLVGRSYKPRLPKKEAPREHVQSSLFSGRGSPPTCYLCNRVGHIARFCPEKQELSCPYILQQNNHPSGFYRPQFGNNNACQSTMPPVRPQQLAPQQWIPQQVARMPQEMPKVQQDALKRNIILSNIVPDNSRTIEPSDIVAQAASASPMNLYCKVKLDFNINDTFYYFDFYIVEEVTTGVLLGVNWLVEKEAVLGLKEKVSNGAHGVSG
eukprot:gene6418-7150_t